MTGRGRSDISQQMTSSSMMEWSDVINIADRRPNTYLSTRGIAKRETIIFALDISWINGNHLGFDLAVT